MADHNSTTVTVGESKESLLVALTKLYKDDRLKQARKALTNLERAFATEEADSPTLTARTQESLNSFLSQHDALPMVAALRREAAAVEKLLADIEDDSRWTNVKESGGGVRTSYHNEKDTPVHTLKVEGELPVSMSDLLVVIAEIDLYVNWIPFLADAKVLVEITNYRKSVYCRAGLPWPMSDRDMFLYGFGADLLEEDKVVIVVRSVNSKADEPTSTTAAADSDEDDSSNLISPEDLAKIMTVVPKSPGGAMRMDCHFAGFVMESLSETRTRLTVLINADPMMSAIPYWLLNYVMKQFGHLIFARLEGLATGIKGSVFEERIQARPALYADLQRRLDARHERKLEAERERKAREEHAEHQQRVKLEKVHKVHQELSHLQL